MKRLLIRLFSPGMICLASLRPAAAQEIGANFNHDPEIIDISYLKKTPVEWVRSTPRIFEYINGSKNPATEAGLQKLIEAKAAGYKVAFGFRWDFKKYDLNIPAPGSPLEKKYFAVARAMLSRLGGNIDNLTLGNEPNLETRDEDLQVNDKGYVPLVRFMQRLLNQVALPYYNAHPQFKRPDIYVGSLPALYEVKQQKTPGVTGLIELAQNTKELAGLAVHLHIADTLQIGKALDFVRKIMPLKPIIVPEFSLFQLYNRHVGDMIGNSKAGKVFARKYGYADNMRLYNWYSIANTKRVGAKEWQELFLSREWFFPHALLTYYRYFRKYHVVLATYGFFSQSAPRQVGPQTPVWFVTPVFACKSLKPGADGSCGKNPLWFDDFVDISNRGRKAHGNAHR